MRYLLLSAAVVALVGVIGFYVFELSTRRQKSRRFHQPV
jgi:hypothetical protein